MLDQVRTINDMQSLYMSAGQYDRRVMAQLRITARMCIGASEGASGYAALRRAAPPHGPSPWLGSGPRHIRAIRYAKCHFSFRG